MGQSTGQPETQKKQKGDLLAIKGSSHSEVLIRRGCCFANDSRTYLSGHWPRGPHAPWVGMWTPEHVSPMSLYASARGGGAHS